MESLWLETWLGQHHGKVLLVVLVCLVLAPGIQLGPQVCQVTSTTGPHSLLSSLYLGVGVCVCVYICVHMFVCMYLCDCKHIHVFGDMCLQEPEDNLSYHSSGNAIYLSECVYMWVGCIMYM